jgi:xanthine dehydrogenase YagT iron-sulfur-binding subunit
MPDPLRGISRGTPCVLAFRGAWSDRPPGEALRAELRGLGASLVLLSPRGATILGGDDEPQSAPPMPDLWRACQVRTPELGGPPLTLVLLDHDGGVRLRRECDAPGDPMATLLDVLRAAGVAVRSAPRGMGRRELLASTLATALGAAALQACKSVPQADTPGPLATKAASLVDVTLTVNGEKHVLRLDPRATLLDTVREHLALTGTKKGCDMGQCGACTVLADGKRINSCLALAAQYDGRGITTIEGLAKGDDLHPMQAAFLEHDGFQCGYCTPGQILSAVALLKENPRPGDDEIREGMSGNVCRCGAYPNIVAAIRAVRGGS